MIVIALCVARPVAAQNGALFLLLPAGSRAVGLAQAVSADTSLGLEGIWWNAAALSRVNSKEVAFNHSQTVLANSELLSIAIPSRIIGTLAISGYFVDYGQQEATDKITGQTTGQISNTNYFLAASYATPVGKRLGIGVTLRWIGVDFNKCSGVCTDSKPANGSTSALDLSAQYVLPTSFPLTIGGSYRNIGPDLQTKDKPQADPLPRVPQFGVSSRIPVKSLKDAGASLDVNADVALLPDVGSGNTSALSVGGELGYQNQYFLRAGIKKQQGFGMEPALGFTLQRGSFSLDFSRRFDQLSSEDGTASQYVSLRVRF